MASTSASAPIATESPGGRDRPLPADWSVARARDAYLAENGFTTAGYDEPWTPAALFGIRFRVPNPPRHRWAIMRHDLHHAATGFGTDLRGEVEISAWEARSGLRGLGCYTGWIVLSLALFGLVIAPRRTLAAWRAARGGSSLFRLARLDYESLLAQPLGELRATLGLPRAGLALRPRDLHTDAPR